MSIGRRLPPYVAYRTFTNYLAELRSRGLPAQIDRTALPHRSGAVQSQLLLALAYLGLIDEAQAPTTQLRMLVEAEGLERRSQLRTLLADSYTFLADDIELASATSQQLEERFAATGTSGETLRRSQSFFLAMAREAGLSVSPYIQPHRGRRQQKRPAPPRSAVQSPAPVAGSSEPTIHRSLELGGAGTVTLSFDGNVFLLDQPDRTFLFGLVDSLAAYGESRN